MFMQGFQNLSNILNFIELHFNWIGKYFDQN